MMQLIREKQQTLWLAVGLMSLAFLALAGWQTFMGGAGQTVTASPTYVTDVSDDRKLVGLSHDVFFGQVSVKEGQTRERGFPETQFTVTVLETLKGKVSGEIQVNQQGGLGLGGNKFRMKDDPDLLIPGASYLFVTRTSTEKGWRTVLSGYGKIKLNVPANAEPADVLKSPDAERLRMRFKNAIANEIPYDPSS